MTKIKKIKQSTINRALRLHKAWLKDKPHGKRLKVTTEIINLIDFNGANFSRANFSDANFSDADFDSANFGGVRLNYISSINAKGIEVICCQLNTSDENRSIQYWKKLGIVTAGCFSGTLDELKTAVDKHHKNKNAELYAKYQVVFNYIDTVLKIESEEKMKKLINLLFADKQPEQQEQPKWTFERNGWEASARRYNKAHRVRNKVI